MVCVGPYEILSALGRGGMGEVHRARHRETGELVALKTVRGARASTLESLRREIHALARLSHPGIVRIVGEGTQDGLPWYAMELLEGRTLRQHAAARAAGALAETEQVWREWWTTQLDAAPATARLDKAAPAPVREGGRADVAEVLAVGARVCEPLAYLHGEGLVHRDLKPENVLVRDDGTTVIVDFGLSSRFGGVVGRDQLEATDLHVGTPVYMSPEQVMGRVVDARSDLYSLGCVLYELLTGRPPFLDQPLAVLQMHVHATPEPPSRLASGIPETLDTLLLRLLAKDPRERMGYADDVARRLREIASPESRVHAAGVRPRAYLYRAALVGRAAPMAALRGALDGLGEGRRAAVLLGGASGAGKTRMLTELVQEARFRGVDVLAGACANDEPLGCLRVPLRAIGDACRERGPGAVDSVLGRHARILARFEGSLAALPGVASMPEPADLPPDAARLRLALALSDTFASAARERPLVLALDDLHDADDLTLAFLEVHLRRGVRDGRLLVAGSYRSDEPRERLAALAGMACVTSVILPPLSPEEVEALAAEMLALDRSPRGLGRLLARQSEGNPLFVAEYLRLAVAEGLLYRDEEGVWRISDAPERDGLRDGREDLPLPTSLRELLSRRLARLGPAASRMLAWAAVLGREPEGAVLARLGGDAGDALAGLRELLTAEVLEPTAAGYRFTHDAIRTLVHDGLSDLPSRHREAALAIEGEHPEREPWLAALGWHWQGAGDVARALPCYLAAARRAVSMFALEEAERLLGAYLALAPAPTEDRVEARRILGQEVLVRRGRHREAEELLRRAVEEAREVGDLAAEAGARRALGLVVNDLGRPAEAVACLEEARELATRAGDVSTQATVTGTLALMHVEQGRLDIAWDLHAEAREIMERAGDRRIEAALVGNMGIAHAERGRMDLAEPLFLRALDAARALGDRRHEGLVQGNLAGLRYRQGRIEEAKGHFEKALAIARETTDLKYEAITRGNIGNLLLDEGRVEEARLMYEGAHAILRSIGIRRNEAILLMGIGAAHQALGRPAEAGGCYREALEIARAVADRFTEARVLGNHARLLAVEGRLDEAEAMFGESLAIARETSDRRFEGIVQAGLASLALLARADVVEAERLGREAERLLQEATDQKELARLGCLLGLVAIARGESAEGHLASARAHAIELRAAPGSLLARDIEVLERAERARAAGQALVAGRSPADLSPGEARWLTSRA